jgi:hypothetical protein
MDSLFFIASKTVGMLARVETWFILLLAAALIGGSGAGGHAQRLASVTLVTGTLALTAFPLATFSLRMLERQFPAAPRCPRRWMASSSWAGPRIPAPLPLGRPRPERWGERVTEGAALARRFPAGQAGLYRRLASLVYSDATHRPRR